MVPEDEGGIPYVFPIYLSEKDRAHLRMVIGGRNRLVDFALTQQIRLFPWQRPCPPLHRRHG
jgi:hypothetical protein